MENNWIPWLVKWNILEKPNLSGTHRFMVWNTIFNGLVKKVLKVHQQNIVTIILKLKQALIFWKYKKLILNYNNPLEDQEASSSCPVESWEQKGRTLTPFGLLKGELLCDDPFRIKWVVLSSKIGHSCNNQWPM